MICQLMLLHIFGRQEALMIASRKSHATFIIIEWRWHYRHSAGRLYLLRTGHKTPHLPFPWASAQYIYIFASYGATGAQKASRIGIIGVTPAYSNWFRLILADTFWLISRMRAYHYVRWYSAFARHISRTPYAGPWIMILLITSFFHFAASSWDFQSVSK